MDWNPKTGYPNNPSIYALEGVCYTLALVSKSSSTHGPAPRNVFQPPVAGALSRALKSDAGETDEPCFTRHP